MNQKYIVYSLIFHAVLFTVFFILIENAPVRKVPTTKITMLRLTPKLGTPTGSPTAPAGIPEPPKKPEEPPPLETTTPKVEPKKQPEVAETKKQPKPKAKPKVKPKPKPKPSTSTVKLKKKQPPKPKTKAVEKPDETKITSALSGIDQQLAEREQQLKSAGRPGAPTSGQPALGSPKGSVTARDPGYARYQSMVRSKITRNWVRTHAGGETQRLSARIRVRINASGAVISKSFAKRSGDASFDNSAMRAVERASPLPAPPPSVMGEALREGFVVHFRSRMLGKN